MHVTIIMLSCFSKAYVPLFDAGRLGRMEMRVREERGGRRGEKKERERESERDSSISQIYLPVV